MENTSNKMPLETDVTLVGVEAKLLALEEKVIALEAQLESLEEAVSTLLEKQQPVKAKKAEAVALKGHVFEASKKKYVLKYPTFNVAGKDVTEDDLLLDQKLAKKLIEENPGLFVEQ